MVVATKIGSIYIGAKYGSIFNLEDKMMTQAAQHVEGGSSPGVDVVRVRVLPNNRLDRENAAKYLGKSPKTLAMWAMEGKGPPVIKVGGRCYYQLEQLDSHADGDMSGAAA